MKIKNAPVLDFLEQLVRINSGTRNTSGVNKVQDLLEQRLASLGLCVTRFKPATVGDLLIAEGGQDQAHPHVVFIAHADTVFEPSSGFVDFRIEDNWAYGPGVIDNKGALVVLCEALGEFLAQTKNSGSKKNKVPLSPSSGKSSKTSGENWPFRFTLMVAPAEETGNPSDVIGEMRRWAQGADFVLGFEPAYDDGSIIESRRGNRWFEIQVSGKEAHSGRNAREGVNAAWALSLVLTDLMSLNFKEQGPKVSIGHLRGGQEKFNIVCGEAVAYVDARFSSMKEREEFDRHLVKSIEKAKTICGAYQNGNTSDFRIRVMDDLMPFSRTSSSQVWLNKYRKILFQCEGQTRQSRLSLGSSDVNIFGDYRKSVLIDGLGPYGSGMHTLQERLYLPSVETRIKALVEFLTDLVQNRGLSSPKKTKEIRNYESRRH